MQTPPELIASLLTAETVGWSVVGMIVSALVWITVQGIKSRGELSVAKENAAVSLNEQGSALILKMVEEQKSELAWMRAKLDERDEELRDHMRNSEKLCDYLIAILKAPDDIMREFQMVQAQAYLKDIGKWSGDE